MLSIMKRAALIFIAMVMTVAFASIFAGSPAQAADPSSNPDPLAANTEKICVAVPIFRSAPQGQCPPGQQEISNAASGGGAIVYYLKEILRLVNQLVGAVIILAIIIAGVQYMISGGDPANVKKAKGRLMNAFTALILYLLMVAILNFLIPGGAL